MNLGPCPLTKRGSHFISPDQLVFVIDDNVMLAAKVFPEPAEGWVSWFFLAQRAWVSF